MGLVALLLLQTLQQQDRTAAARGVDSLKNEPGDLVLWALAATDVEEHSPDFRRRLEEAGKGFPPDVRSAAWRALALQRLDAWTWRRELRRCAVYLAENQAVDGLWGPGTMVEPFEEEPPDARRRGIDFDLPWRPAPYVVEPRRQGPARGDAESARWAVEGLRACALGGASFPAALLDRTAAAWTSGERDPAWTLASLCILRWLQKRDVRLDPDVKRAAERLAAQAGPTEPGPLFARIRAQTLFDGGLLSGTGWFEAGIEKLRAGQGPDGRWGGVEETVLGALVLHRSVLHPNGGRPIKRSLK